MRVLVCGSRNWDDWFTIYDCLDRVASVIKIETVIEGGATGADRYGRNWANRHGIPVETYPADWERYGLRAGGLRNARMLHEGRPDLVIAFPLPNSRGTWNMVKTARDAGVKVWIMPGALAEVDALGEGVFT